MNRKEFIELLSQRLGTSTSLANGILTEVLGTIVDVLSKGWEVNLKWFGKFLIVSKNSKKGYNLHTKQPLVIKAYKAMIFKTGKNLKKLFK